MKMGIVFCALASSILAHHVFGRGIGECQDPSDPLCCLDCGGTTSTSSSSTSTTTSSSTSTSLPTGFLYVALGDSYPGGYSRATCPDDLCASDTTLTPATAGYPKRLLPLLRRVHPDATLVDLSTWGATTTDLIAKQLPLISCPATRFTYCPDVVTVTVGAGDLDYANPTWFAMTRGVRRSLASHEATAVIAPHLATILDALHTKAPQALVIVTNYPNPSDHGHCGTLAALGADLLLAGNKIGLDEMIGATAHDHGALFVNLPGPFSRHGVESKKNWFFGTSCEVVTTTLDAWQNIDPHPNAIGHQCIANLTWEVSKRTLGSRERRIRTPCRYNLTAE